MKLKESSRSLLSGFSPASVERGIALLEELNDGFFTARFDDGENLATVVLEVTEEGSRLACTCGVSECDHQAALLAALMGDESLPQTQKPSSPQPQTAEGSSPSKADLTTGLAEAIDSLIGTICALGLTEESEERDLALAAVIQLLAGQDLPDIKRAVATVRRTLTSSSPEPSTAWQALSRLSRLADELRETISQGGSSTRGVQKRTERKEEVRLLEVARYTQRTPFGDRRDVLYFLDLDEDVLYRELAASLPGSSPVAISEGPFSKRILGNLVSIDEGPSPRRIRMLQYATVGFATADDLDHLLECCKTEVESLYEIVRHTIELGLDAAEKVVMFSPDSILKSPTGIVLCDDDGALLPLARGRNPALCGAVDLLARQGRLLAIVGQLVLGTQFISILPLTALIELPTGRSLRRIA